MDAAFLLEEPVKSQLFRSMMHTLGCVYACLWSYLPQPSNCLISLDGYYNEGENEASTSSGSLARKLFEEYRQSIISIEDQHVPGLAFRNSRPYVELMRPDILRLAYSDTQRLFYQESGIQKVVFMGCKKGEIELGFSRNFPQMNLEMGLREWFPEDLVIKPRIQPEVLPHHQHDQNPPVSSSSSSLRSLDSPSNVSDYSPNVFTNIINPTTSHKLPESPCFTQPPYMGIVQGQSLREREEEAMARAILAVLTSPSTTSSSSSSSQQNILSPKASAFKKYHGPGAGKAAAGPSCLRKQSMIKRATSYYQRLNRFWRERQATAGAGAGTGGGGGGSGGSPTTSQLHHMISERKRREKLNESIQALRLLLPQGTKKDKASVLNAARDQLLSLQAEINKLVQRNREMEAKLERERDFERLFPSQRFSVRVIHALETTSQERIVDLRVVFRGETIRIDDLVVRLLEFLKSDRNASLISIEAQTQTQEETPVSLYGIVSLKLKFEGEWDESAFLEAVSRVVADMPH